MPRISTGRAAELLPGATRADAALGRADSTAIWRMRYALEDTWGVVWPRSLQPNPGFLEKQDWNWPELGVTDREDG